MSASSVSPDKHIAATRARLAHLGELAERTAATERNILAAAEDRLKAVMADLDTLRARVNLDPDAAERYAARTLERGQLETVIARARQVLGR